MPIPFAKMGLRPYFKLPCGLYVHCLLSPRKVLNDIAQNTIPAITPHIIPPFCLALSLDKRRKCTRALENAREPFCKKGEDFRPVRECTGPYACPDFFG